MIASTIHYSTPDLLQGKSQTAQDIYLRLLGELNKIGPVKETKKEISVSFENRKTFASVLIRNRSLKLTLRTTHKIASPRIRYSERVAKNSYDNTIFLESKAEIDEELMNWLGDAYQAGK